MRHAVQYRYGTVMYSTRGIVYYQVLVKTVCASATSQDTYKYGTFRESVRIVLRLITGYEYVKSQSASDICSRGPWMVSHVLYNLTKGPRILRP